MDNQHLSAPSRAADQRRIVAVGIIRRTPRHTTRITATAAGITGSIKAVAR